MIITIYFTPLKIKNKNLYSLGKTLVKSSSEALPSSAPATTKLIKFSSENRISSFSALSISFKMLPMSPFSA
jgi:hypothetical protein